MAVNPADVVRQVLIDLGLGTEPGTAPWPVYAKKEPSMPDDTVTVYNGPGTDDGRVMHGEGQGLFTFIIRIRASDGDEGWSKAADILAAMETQVYRMNVEVDGQCMCVHSFSNISNVVDIGYESPTSERRIHTLTAASYINSCGDQ